MKSRKFSERLILAVELPRFAREKLTQQRSVWRKTLDEDVRWLPPLNLHLHLRHVGELELSASKSLCRRLATIAENTPAFRLLTSGISGTPSSKEANLVWLDYQPCAELDSLLAQINGACREQKVAPDKKPFFNRTLLGRCTEPANLPKLNLPSDFQGFVLKGFSLIESRETQKGSTLHQVQRFLMSKPPSLD